MVSCFAMMFVSLWKFLDVNTPDLWRLFIDSPKVSLKVVLLHNGNGYPSL